MFESLKNLESLETLVILDPYSDTYIRLEKHSFLNRVKNLFLPSIDWLENVTECSNLKSLGFQNIPGEAPEFWFSRIQNFYILFCYYDMFDPLLNFVKKLSLVNLKHLI